MLAMFVGGICKGIIGVALPLVGISIMVMLIDVKLAVAMIVIPIVVTNMQMALRSGWPDLVEAIRRFWPLVVTCFITLLSVAVFAHRFSSSAILIGLGVALMIFVMANTSPWRPQCRLSLKKLQVRWSASCLVPWEVLHRSMVRP